MGGRGAAAGAGTAGTAAAPAAPGAAASDERLKQDIESTSAKDIKSFLNAIKSKDYNYKDEKFGKGRHTGFMIQDIEKTKLGKEMVIETDEGKMYNMQKMQGTMLASIEYLHNELKKTKKKGV